MRSLLVVATIINFVGAFGPTLFMTRPLQTAVNALPAKCRSTGTFTRKRCLEQMALVISSAFAVANPAFAKDALEEDKQKLVVGYNRLNYLVDNWEKEVRFPLSLAGFHGIFIAYLCFSVSLGFF